MSVLWLCLVVVLMVSAAHRSAVVTASSEATVYVDPPRVRDETLVAGETFDVNVTVREVTDLFLWEIWLTFDPTILEGVDVVEPYPEPEQIWMFIIDEIDNTDGWVHVLGSRPFGVHEGLSGTWKLCMVIFNVLAEGGSDLHIYETSELRDVENVLIDHDVEDGYFSNLPPIHDVAITDVTAFPTEMWAGGTVTINVTVSNEGEFDETFSVTAYYDDTPAAPAQTVTDLAPEANETLTFTWNTTDVAEGTYTIGANASVVEGETDTDDNTLSNGEVTILPPPPEVHDVAITSVTASPTSVTSGDLVSITVVAENEGGFTESFDVTVYWDGNSVGTKTVTDLAIGADRTLTFTWNTTDVAEGTYTIEVNTSVIQGETDTADNTYTDGTVTVTEPPPEEGEEQQFPVELIAVAVVAVAIIGSVAIFFYTRRGKS